MTQFKSPDRRFTCDACCVVARSPFFIARDACIWSHGHFLLHFSFSPFFFKCSLFSPFYSFLIASLLSYNLLFFQHYFSWSLSTFFLFFAFFFINIPPVIFFLSFSNTLCFFLFRPSILFSSFLTFFQLTFSTTSSQ